MERKSHWEKVYQDSEPTKLGWYRQHLEGSLELIGQTGVTRSTQVIDVGGGCSTLVDDLLDLGFKNISILDISSRAIQVAKERLSNRGNGISWIEADITQVSLTRFYYDLWHDRAVFHFLTRPEDRRAYVTAVEQSIKPGGHMIIATFSLAAPPRCSGLDVIRYSAESLYDEFRKSFLLIRSFKQEHITPSHVKQQYIYCYFKKTDDI
jgi:2-polyprenyl-3-methyl-5-hydroxy-6-metoxy-1,4-benzoquinol methylase